VRPASAGEVGLGQHRQTLFGQYKTSAHSGHHQVEARPRRAVTGGGAIPGGVGFISGADHRASPVVQHVGQSLGGAGAISRHHDRGPPCSQLSQSGGQGLAGSVPPRRGQGDHAGAFRNGGKADGQQLVKGQMKRRERAHVAVAGVIVSLDVLSRISVGGVS